MPAFLAPLLAGVARVAAPAVARVAGAGGMRAAAGAAVKSPMVKGMVIGNAMSSAGRNANLQQGQMDGWFPGQGNY